VKRAAGLWEFSRPPDDVDKAKPLRLCFWPRQGFRSKLDPDHIRIRGYVPISKSKNAASLRWAGTMWFPGRAAGEWWRGVCVCRPPRCGNSGFRRTIAVTRGRRAVGSARAPRARARTAAQYSLCFLCVATRCHKQRTGTTATQPPHRMARIASRASPRNRPRKPVQSGQTPSIIGWFRARFVRPREKATEPLRPPLPACASSAPR
jgi:hypothetical protein